MVVHGIVYLVEPWEILLQLILKVLVHAFIGMLCLIILFYFLFSDKHWK